MNFSIELLKVGDLTEDQQNGLAILKEECGVGVEEAGAFAYLLAIAEKKIISSVTLYKNKKTGLIGRVCVARDHRHHGIVSSMLKRALVVLKKEQCEIASLTVDQGNKTYAVYENLGFKMSDDKNSKPGTMFVDLL